MLRIVINESVCDVFYLKDRIRLFLLLLCFIVLFCKRGRNMHHPPLQALHLNWIVWKLENFVCFLSSWLQTVEGGAVYKFLNLTFPWWETMKNALSSTFANLKNWYNSLFLQRSILTIERLYKSSIPLLSHNLKIII